MLSKMMNLRVLILIASICYAVASPVTNKQKCPVRNPAVVNFQQYIQIDTSQAENLDKATEFLRRLAAEVGLEFTVYEPAGKPICVLTWPGANPTLPAIMLNSHVDVVYAEPSEWKYPPFSGYIDENCNMYGRGTQDTKDVGIQYIEAIRKLKQQKVQPKRTVHITFMPDEETGGFQGMRVFIETDEFKDLNIGFALDEGMTSSTDDLYACYQDKRPWSINITVHGIGGHGSSISGTPTALAIEKLYRLLDVMLDYKRSLDKAVEGINSLSYGHYTTMNVNMVNGGRAPNVIPTSFSVVADLRLASTANATEFLSLVNSWANYAGNDSKVEFLRQEMESLPTTLDSSNVYWTALNETVFEQGFNLIPLLLPATSDMLFVRNHGIPAIGFAPKFRTQSNVHKNNEYLNINTFLRGIEVYEAIIKKLVNLPDYDECRN